MTIWKTVVKNWKSKNYNWKL